MLLFFPNSMFTPYFKSYVLSGEIAIRNKHYYYYYYFCCSLVAFFVYVNIQWIALYPGIVILRIKVSPTPLRMAVIFMISS